MATTWYYRNSHAEFGPVSSSDLKHAAESGNLLPTDLIRRSDRTDWVQASTVKNLFVQKPGAMATVGQSNIAPPATAKQEVISQHPATVHMATPKSTIIPARPASEPISTAPTPIPMLQSNSTDPTKIEPSYRVMSGGVVAGPYPASKLRAMIEQGELSPNDLISVQAWLPIATLSLSAVSGPAQAASPSAGLLQVQSANSHSSPVAASQGTNWTPLLAAGGSMLGSFVQGLIQPSKAEAQPYSDEDYVDDELEEEGFEDDGDSDEEGGGLGELFGSLADGDE